MGDERERDGFSTQFAAPLMQCRPAGAEGERRGRTVARQVKKCPCPCCCLFQQHRLTNCPRTNRDKRIEEKRGNYKGQIELEVSYSASECELRTARGASESASSSSLLVAVSIILHLIRRDDDDGGGDEAAMAFFSLPFSDRNLALVRSSLLPPSLPPQPPSASTLARSLALCFFHAWMGRIETRREGRSRGGCSRPRPFRQTLFLHYSGTLLPLVF